MIQILSITLWTPNSGKYGISIPYYGDTLRTLNYGNYGIKNSLLWGYLKDPKLWELGYIP